MALILMALRTETETSEHMDELSQQMNYGLYGKTLLHFSIW